MAARLITTEEGNKYGKGEGYNQLCDAGSELQVSKYILLIVTKRHT